MCRRPSAIYISGLVIGDNSRTFNGLPGDIMKYLLFVILLCLAGLEYFHHLSLGHTHHENIHTNAQTAPEAKVEHARDMFRQHLYRH